MLIANVEFVTMIYTTDYTPFELASAISIIMGLFIINKSIRTSAPDKIINTNENN
jgi:hypothetical protein